MTKKKDPYRSSSSISMKKFLHTDYDTFIREYDRQFIEYIEWKRRHSNDKWKNDFVNFEKEFIDIIGNYLYLKNLSVLEKDEEEDMKIEEQLLREHNTSSEALRNLSDNIDSIKDDGKRKEIYELKFEYFKLRMNKEKFLEGNNNREIMTSYNYKIHYLTLRANRIGFDASFGKEVKFNENISDDLFDLTSNNKFSKPQKFIILNELGIIEFLREKYDQLSENVIGKILMDITGETNFQDKLSGYKNKGPNDPYNNKNAVEIIKTHLMLNRNIDLNKQ